ncbi:MAG TPA: hypothetical protein VLC92_18575 [Rhodocyclaceae bacterium]|nr:hypothetical protein [Rhodocyclaceae bacterium]
MKSFIPMHALRRMALTLFAMTTLIAGFIAPAQADFFDCKDFDDRSLCKQLNRYPIVKDLPLITAGRALELYRTKPGYAGDLMDGNPIAIEGTVATTEEKSGHVSVSLAAGVNPADVVVLGLFAAQPVAGKDGRVASRTAKDARASLPAGTKGVFQCVGDGLNKKVPMFKNCVYWR